ncbi:TrkH family potassium uptake protein [Draconibacterium sediminis]|uniref:TrkH family potassium uptake protein n=1 Tax=Draconibacterium sediminis TaxID=1544798 RepID=UPI0026EF5298|nr:potassium transporter TrkG [Draconibacterium sediminis]
MSLFLFLEGGLLLLCLFIALVNSEPVWFILVPSFIAFLVGGLTYLYFKNNSKMFSIKEHIVFILFIWIVSILIGTIPFLISKSFHSFADSLFESVSGFTATGTTTLTNPESLPKSILFWRSLTQWYGGILTISMLLLVFPEINIGGYKLFAIERDKKNLIIRVFIVYIILTVVQVLLLSAGGNNLFKSFCISFATISTGCFLPDKTSIGDYTPFAQIVMAVFMFLSGLGGLFYYKLSILKRSNFKVNEEFRFYSISFLTITVLFAWILHSMNKFNGGEIIRGSIFQTVSFLSSTGYEISEYRLWPHYVQPFLYLLIVVGGCTNSSSGGIKISRFLVLFRNIRMQFKNPLRDAEVAEISYNGQKINEETNLNILTFITIFGFVLVVGTLVLTFITNDLKKSVFLTVTALSTFGHNMGLTDIPHVGKIFVSMLMLIGRLGIFPFLALLLPSFYKKSIQDS